MKLSKIDIDKFETIVEFLGLEPIQTNYGVVYRWNDGEVYELHEMKFNYKFDWIMVVLDKIEQTTFRSTSINWSARWGYECRITRTGGVQDDTSYADTRIQAVYDACCKFIPWWVMKMENKCTMAFNCTCAEQAMKRGANRDVVDGIEADCPHRSKL